MENDNKGETIDIKAVCKRLYKKKRFILKVLVITFVLSCFYILPQPRYYKCTVELAPEIGRSMLSSGGLTSLASSMGLDINNTMLSDAISPELYPELMKSNGFIVNLVGCKVRTKDQKVNTTYFSYLQHYQKSNPLTVPLAFIKKLFERKSPDNEKGKLDPFNLTKDQDDIFKAIQGKIMFKVDKKTSLVSIEVQDQDPLVAATMADSTMAKLQEFITRYRTSKARHDMEYYRNLAVKAKADYEKSRRLYGSYADSNMDIILESYKSKQEDLENDMQLKYNAYKAMIQQLQTAEAEVLADTPVFTVVKSASVPINPAGPKRMIFVGGMMFLALFITSFTVTKDLII
ncbi:chain-length determining protein [Prevotella sp. oral taxon 376]|uniref:chain-length determining protein n=1 Tax=Prevotella sp. oral taxon 376 TaxID=712466 RepID=UPI000D1DFA80|nr:chain-length determining protein [Prevotella sp. oral taxon 376]PTL34251.1 chain-length determining protein [Prevotella sp. oral taxon 376]